MTKFAKNPIIAILGGTGSLGRGLAYRLAKSGYTVIIGSRDASCATLAAENIKRMQKNENVIGCENREAASASDIVVLTVPYAHQKATLKHVRDVIHGKILIDTTVSLRPPKVDCVQLPKEGSAGLIAQKLVGDVVDVVSAFQNIAANHLCSDDNILCDILVTANNVDAAEAVINIARDISLNAWYAGPILNSVATEAMTSLLISINKRYKLHGAGIVISHNQ